MSAMQERGQERDPLTHAQLATLESIAQDGHTRAEKLVAGHLAWCAHTRGRWDDSVAIEAEPKIVGEFVEAVTSKIKNSNAATKRGKVIPLVAHAMEVTMTPWAEAWLQTRKDMGLGLRLKRQWHSCQPWPGAIRPTTAFP